MKFALKNVTDYEIRTQPETIFYIFTKENYTALDNPRIRKKIILNTSRMLNYFGYQFIQNDVKQVQKLVRKENNIYVGLMASISFKYATTLMKFLNSVDMEKASSLVMLALCKAYHKNIKIANKINRYGVMRVWMSTHKYLHKHIICNLTGLQYTGNSCYQDSTLLALFGIPNNFITENILNKDLMEVCENKNRDIVCSKNPRKDFERRSAIQEELKRITLSMRGVSPGKEKCSNLRSLLKYCPSSSGQAFYSTGTQDAGEFVQYLFSLFQVEGVTTESLVFATNNLELRNTSEMVHIRTTKNKRNSPIILVQSSYYGNAVSLQNLTVQIEDSHLDEKNLYKADDGKLYRRRVNINKISNAEMLIFYDQRKIFYQGHEIRTYVPIIADEEIMVEQSALLLYAIVVHRNEHYTCYINCENVWFYYNDLSEKIVTVGDFDSMRNWNGGPNIEREGVLFFYKLKK